MGDERERVLRSRPRESLPVHMSKPMRMRMAPTPPREQISAHDVTLSPPAVSLLDMPAPRMPVKLVIVPVGV